MEELKPGKIEPVIEEEITVNLPYKVILFNDDIHTFDEVIEQLMKATGCNYEQAKKYAFEAHVKGKAIVYSGELSDCLRVTSILEEIALHTQIVS